MVAFHYRRIHALGDLRHALDWARHDDCSCEQIVNGRSYVRGALVNKPSDAGPLSRNQCKSIRATKARRLDDGTHRYADALMLRLVYRFSDSLRNPVGDGRSAIRIGCALTPKLPEGSVLLTAST